MSHGYGCAANMRLQYQLLCGRFFAGSIFDWSPLLPVRSMERVLTLTPARHLGLGRTLEPRLRGTKTISLGTRISHRIRTRIGRRPDFGKVECDPRETQPGMLWVDRVGDRRSQAILARYFSEKNGDRHKRTKTSKNEELVSRQEN